MGPPTTRSRWDLNGPAPALALASPSFTTTIIVGRVFGGQTAAYRDHRVLRDGRQSHPSPLDASVGACIHDGLITFVISYFMRLRAVRPTVRDRSRNL